MEKSFRKNLRGHLSAALAVTVWGSAFIATAKLLASFSELEVVLLRFIIAYLFIWILFPHRRRMPARDEIRIALSGVLGCTLYFWSENLALAGTSASTVSILVSTSPVFVALLEYARRREKQTLRGIFTGFALAMTGVILTVSQQIPAGAHWYGSLFALLASLCWAGFAFMQAPLLERYPPVLLTRKLLFYGILSILPLLLIRNRPFPISAIFQSGNLYYLLFLGIAGSGIGFLLWNTAQELLGVVRSNNYLYAVPFVTLAVSFLFLGEPVTLRQVAGSVLIVCGVAVSASQPSDLPDHTTEPQAD